MGNRLPGTGVAAGQCTVIESMQGRAKLIIRADSSGSKLVALDFPDLKDCLEFAAQNCFQVKTVYSGRRRDTRPKA